MIENISCNDCKFVKWHEGLDYCLKDKQQRLCLMIRLDNNLCGENGSWFREKKKKNIIH